MVVRRAARRGESPGFAGSEMSNKEFGSPLSLDLDGSRCVEVDVSVVVEPIVDLERSSRSGESMMTTSISAT